MKKKWLCLLVENETGVLAKIAGLFAGKLYNLDSLTVGTTEDETISRMTIGLTSDDKTFEQIKKQLNRSIEVIKVEDYTDISIHIKELMFIKIINCLDSEKSRLIKLADTYKFEIFDKQNQALLLECLQPETQNNQMIEIIKKDFESRIEIVRGGSVAIEN